MSRGAAKGASESRAMTGILAEQSEQKRRVGDTTRSFAP
jgi:hypothetical protein